MEITLYSLGKKDNDLSRVSRVRWMLHELEAPYEEVDVREAGLFGTPEFRAISGLGAVPAVRIGDRTWFESAAICTILADRFPEKGLIAPSGTDLRAEHEQWVSFALTGMEAWLWSTAKHTFRYPEEKRVKAVVPSNSEEFRDAADVLEKHLASREYMVGGKFSATDVVVAYTLNWARVVKLLDPFTNLSAYLDRMWARPACTLPRSRG